MKYEVPVEQIALIERQNTFSSKTNHKEFDEKGYLLVKNLWDPNELYCEPPNGRGQFDYNKECEIINHIHIERQVAGSTSRYNYFPYRIIHSQIRLKIEKIIGKKLYNTYYYDRFYYPGQELMYHVDRDSCEISVSIHVSSNVNEPWDFCIKEPDTYNDPKLRTEILKYGEPRSIKMNPGDAVIYKGCERPHWREPLPKEYTKTWYGKKIEKENLYYHQIFFHYVLADGIRAHWAWDAPSN